MTMHKLNKTVIAYEAWQSMTSWMATSLKRLAMTAISAEVRIL
jgi:hypothetical protein